jgi:hypothetical protein
MPVQSIPTDSGPKKVAIIVDVDTVRSACRSLETTVMEALRQLKFTAVGLGILTVARAFSSNPWKYAKRLHELGYEPILMGREVEARLTAEITSMLDSMSDIGVFVIASGNRDLEFIARPLLDARKYVVVVGVHRPSNLALVANGFVPWKKIVRGKAEAAILRGHDGTISIPNVQMQVFLCHSSTDKAQVRELSRRLREDGFDPWLDEEKLLPGQDWQMQISTAVRSSGVVIVCLSASSITKEGFVQKEIKQALDVADEKPDGTIFIIPVRLEECDVPIRLRKWQWVDNFTGLGYASLLKALDLRQRSMPIS